MAKTSKKGVYLIIVKKIKENQYVPYLSWKIKEIQQSNLTLIFPITKSLAKHSLKSLEIPPDSVFSLKISFHSILSTLSPRKINYKKYDVCLFKTNQQGKCAFAEHSTTRWLSFLLPSFLTPSWSSYYNLT